MESDSPANARVVDRLIRQLKRPTGVRRMDRIRRSRRGTTTDPAINANHLPARVPPAEPKLDQANGECERTDSGSMRCGQEPPPAAAAGPANEPAGQSLNGLYLGPRIKKSHHAAEILPYAWRFIADGGRV